MKDSTNIDNALLEWEAVSSGEFDFELSIELTEKDINAIQQLARDSYREGMDAGIKYALVITRQAMQHLEQQLGKEEWVTLNTSLERMHPN